MTAFVPVWASVDPTMTSVNLMSANPTTATSTSLGTEPASMIVRGADPSLGFGEFIYAQNSSATSIAAGNVCEITATTYTSGLSVSMINSAQQWQGAANSGKTLGVALSALTQYQYGWFQVYGNALVISSGTTAAGDGAYYSAAGTVKSAAVAGKQVLNMQAMVAEGSNFGQAVWVSGTGLVQPALSSTQTIYFLNRPFAQGAIT